MKDAVVYFYKLAGQSAKSGFFDKPQVGQSEMQMTEEINLIKFGIPEHYYKRKPWKADKLNRLLSEKISRIEENIIYRVADNNCQDMIDIFEERVPWELIEISLSAITGVEGLLILEGETQETEAIVARYAPHLNFLGIQTERDYSELEENLYEEYGLMVNVGEDASKFFFPPMKKMLVVDMGAPVVKWVRKVPAGTIYFDIQSNIMKKKRILAKRSDIQYTAILDTIRKNGYNT